ncbi:hypothetical protein L0663_25050 [Dyadobacter sp. CY107]|uniref:hypothetical protein n=1 Tax=Dyadobacter fanqingshengii TaxID=2906443 RepID=UPI001F193873|nr:hypothetical protein [Dyadobacter fanqingshengii]MCF2506684.1 hypothetical protein [Dyadobacter fanqingshengii]
MKDKRLIPETLQAAYREFSTLQSEEEKKDFFKKMTRDENQFAPGILEMHIKEGLSALSDRVDALLKKVKQPI